jgi:hypothetical protein
MQAAAPAPDTREKGALAEMYVVPPFSILNTAAGAWQNRKRFWLSMGIKSELGRGEALMNYGVELRADNMDYYRAETKRTRAYNGGEINDIRPATPAGGLLGLGSSETVGAKWHGTLGQDGNNGRPTAARSESMFGMDPVDTRRRTADQRANEAGNVSGAPLTPEWASETGMENMAPGTSIFDPVLCELAYRWWCPAGGTILDPFSGGSVRGIVAAYMGHPYVGIDLSGPQVAANGEQADLILGPEHPRPRWNRGDSLEVLPSLDVEADVIFSCPPYADLEVYSDHPRDISNMKYADFLEAYRGIIAAAAAKLRDDRFAVWVVGEVRNKRDPDGAYLGLIPDTIAAFRDAGMRFYNEAVLVNAVGSLPVRAHRQFDTSRKIGKHHQNVLVFLKGHVPRGWSVERVAPPDPQISMDTLLGVPEPDPIVAVLDASLDAADEAGLDTDAVMAAIDDPATATVGGAAAVGADDSAPVAAVNVGDAGPPQPATTPSGAPYVSPLREDPETPEPIVHENQLGLDW